MFFFILGTSSSSPTLKNDDENRSNEESYNNIRINNDSSEIINPSVDFNGHNNYNSCKPFFVYGEFNFHINKIQYRMINFLFPSQKV